MDDEVTFTPPPAVVPDTIAPGSPVIAQAPDPERGLSVRQPIGTLPSSYREYPVVEGIPLCEKCGMQHVTLDAHVSCRGHNAEGQPCRAYALRGTVLCRKHGGAAGQVQRKARQRLAEDEARKTLAEVDVVSIGNPIDELAQLAAEMLALKDHWADEVNQLESMRFTNDKGGEEIRSEVELYERGLDRVERILSTLVRIGFEEQRLQLEERRAHQVTLFITGILADLDLRIEDPRVRTAIERWSPLLDGETGPDDITDAEIVG